MSDLAVTPSPSDAARDVRLHAAAAERNGAAILGELRQFCCPDMRVLEIASGPGQHAALFAEALPDVVWQPSDPDERMRASQSAWTRSLGNVAEPLDLDVLRKSWWRAVADPPNLMICINMLHCTVRESVEGLVAGAGMLLGSGECLLIYGPFRFNGEYSAESNRNFDRILRQQNRAWGLRDINDIVAAGHRHGLEFERAIDMPSSNHLVVLRCA